MNDETPDLQIISSSGEASSQPDAGREPAKKKRTKVSAKAATAALEARIGHKFSDATLLATAFTHVSALKSARKRAPAPAPTAPSLMSSSSPSDFATSAQLSLRTRSASRFDSSPSSALGNARYSISEMIRPST